MNFPSTNWKQLGEATLNGDSRGRRALEAMCEAYRAPVIGFLRMRGYGADLAEDLAQQLYLELLEKQSWRRADRAKGRFRTFLLGILMNVLSSERQRAGAEKRGSGVAPLSLDELESSGHEVSAGEENWQFDRQWALGLVAGALSGTEASIRDAGRDREWPVLVRFLPGSGAPPTYEEAMAELEMTLPAVKSAVNRVRQKFREELRRAVSATVSAPHEIDEELAYLRDVLTKVI